MHVTITQNGVINADGTTKDDNAGSMGHNMYLYCANNPILITLPFMSKNSLVYSFTFFSNWFNNCILFSLWYSDMSRM